MSAAIGSSVAAILPVHAKRSYQGEDLDEPLKKRPRANSTQSESSYSGSRSSIADGNPSHVVSTPHTPLTPSSPSTLQPLRRKTHFCSYPDCGKAFNRPARLEEHIRSHTNSRPFKCPHAPCDKDFLRQSHLVHHIKSAHTSIRDYACNWVGCSKRFLTATRLRRHQQAHEGREQFRCTGFPPCAETYRKHATLQKHIDKDHLHRKPHPCDEIDVATGQRCGSGYDTAAKLRAHKKKHHDEQATAGRYWCSLCSAIEQLDASEAGGFASYSDLRTHIALVHPQQCDECALVCSSASELQRHVEIHHSGATLDERRTFPCTVPECGKAFTKRGNLNVHVRSVHAELRPFVCGVSDLSNSRDLQDWAGEGACRQSFGAKSTLEAHVRSQHLGLPHPARRRPAATDDGTQSDVSTVAKLTGAGYAEESGRDIACFDVHCPHRFLREYDLRVHAVARHGMSDADIAEAFREREALTGGAFWIGGFDGFDLQSYAAPDGTDAWLMDGEQAPAPQNWDFDFSLSNAADATLGCPDDAGIVDTYNADNERDDLVGGFIDPSLADV